MNNYTIYVCESTYVNLNGQWLQSLKCCTIELYFDMQSCVGVVHISFSLKICVC